MTRPVPPRVTSLPPWKALVAQCRMIEHRSLRSLFAEEPERGRMMAAEGAGLYLDYSKNLVTGEILRLLLELARECRLSDHIAAMFRGEHINRTENRAVLHVALRMPADRSLVVDGVDVVREVDEVLDRMETFSRKVR